VSTELSALAVRLSSRIRKGSQSLPFCLKKCAVAGRIPREGLFGKGMCFARPYARFSAMTKLLEQALRQIERLTEAEQDAAAGALLDYVNHMRDLRLTDT
jgi:hypothetical protein